MARDSMMSFVRGTPERCPQAAPSSVEALFAPCLAASRTDMQPPADIASFYLPRPVSRLVRRVTHCTWRPVFLKKPSPNWRAEVTLLIVGGNGMN